MLTLEQVLTKVPGTEAAGWTQTKNGGWVYTTASVATTAVVTDNAIIYDKAQVTRLRVTANIFVDGKPTKQYIAASTGLAMVGGKLLAYKGVWQDQNGFRSDYDRTFHYAPGVRAVALNVDPDNRVSCGGGLHVGPLDYTLAFGDTTIAVEVLEEDIITCQEGKLRVKALTPLRIVEDVRGD